MSNELTNNDDVEDSHDRLESTSSEASENLQELSDHLKERVKELSCLYEISKVSNLDHQSLEEKVLEIKKIIPKGFQYPEELRVNILLGDELNNQKEYSPSLSSSIKSDGIEKGEIIVYYKTHPKKNILHSFLNEEQQLLNQISKELGTLIARYEQKERESLLQKKIQHSDRLAVLGELTAGIAHELNTPLGNILGYAELLKKSDLDSKHQSDVQRIFKSAITAREIVKKLMYFSCEMPAQYELHDLNALINEALDLLKIQLRDHSISVIRNFESDLPKIRIDNIQITQVLFNLILNAIAAMPKGGELNISTQRVNKSIEIRIKDTGKGITEKNLSKIFQPFFTTKDGGTGLGLSVVHGIIQSHRGAIVVNSEVNKGTEFAIQLQTSD